MNTLEIVWTIRDLDRELPIKKKNYYIFTSNMRRGQRGTEYRVIVALYRAECAPFDMA